MKHHIKFRAKTLKMSFEQQIKFGKKTYKEIKKELKKIAPKLEFCLMMDTDENCEKHVEEVKRILKLT